MGKERDGYEIGIERPGADEGDPSPDACRSGRGETVPAARRNQDEE